ncbi:phage major capsid protein [Rickettsia hoogstraalii]|uniref:phage major capsid protein n=1 Tax=Rickettsia hoogstraalii TaxID=467174 RepID=UPI00225452C5|nr:phage major capsid protein [Rickettsia hoogstraalii]MCX4083486.1 phage major capsid protein [Rickettsia hoogstraalii]
MTNTKLQLERNNINSPGIIEQRYAILSMIGMEEAKNRRFWITFSSEEPAERFFGLEILDHKHGSVLLDWLSSGNAPLLLDHDHTKQIGVIEAAELTGDGKARAKVRFSRSTLAESIYQDVLDGIRSNISVGYRYLSSDIVLEKEAKGNKPPVFRIKRWEPLEISVVSIPADPTVGIGRSKEKQEPKKVSDYKYGVRSNMENEQIINENTNFVNDIRTINTVNTEQITKDIRQTETNRINEILALGDKHNMQAVAMEFIKDGKSLDNFRQKILEHLGNQQTIETISPDQSLIGMNDKEARSFSIVKAIKAAVAGNWRGVELEREASSEVSKRIGREPASFFIPADVMLEQNNYERKDLQKLVNTAGGYLVSTDYLSGNFIELLCNKMLVRQMGAKVMSGLHGDIAIPKQTGGATAFWVAEGESPQKSQQTFGQVTLSPKSIAAYTDFSRKLILQASPDIEQLVREDLATTIALEIDRAAILGSGKGAEPLGILNHKISKVNIADDEQIDFGKIVDLESSIASKNADIGSLGYLCNAALRGHLKQTEKADGTAQFIWESYSKESGFGYLNGYKVGTTNQMPADTLLFGNFADLIIGQWGVLDVLVDPYALGTSGGIRIRLMQDIDIAIRHPESFAVAKK